MEITLNVVRINVLVNLSNRNDQIYIVTETRAPYANEVYAEKGAQLQLEATPGYAVRWVKDNLPSGVPIEVTDCGTGEITRAFNHSVDLTQFL